MPETPRPVLLTADMVLPYLGQRLDIFIAASLQRSRNHAQALLKRGRVEMRPEAAKAQASYRLREGDSVSILPDDGGGEPKGQPSAEAIPLAVIYEDDDLLAINKQPGLVVHPAAGHRTGTLVNALLHHCGAHLAQRGGAERLGLVHRLDKDTSGLLLVAKTDLAHERLAFAFAERQVRKYYRALSWGIFRKQSGECKTAIGRHRVHRQKMTVLKSGGRDAHTDYRVLTQGRFGADVECLLHTGRTHQIRVHLAHLGHPIWGDMVYGRNHLLADGFTPTRQMLHAARLEIAHPVSGEHLKLEASLPDDYVESRQRLLETR